MRECEGVADGGTIAHRIGRRDEGGKDQDTDDGVFAASLQRLAAEFDGMDEGVVQQFFLHRSGGGGDGEQHGGNKDQRALQHHHDLVHLAVMGGGDSEDQAEAAGVEEVRMTVTRDISEIEIEGQPMFIEAKIKVTAQGRPRIAVG